MCTTVVVLLSSDLTWESNRRQKLDSKSRRRLTQCRSRAFCQKMMWVLGQAVRLVSAMISSGRTSTAPPATSLVFSV